MNPRLISIFCAVAFVLVTAQANAANFQSRLPATMGGMDYQAYYDPHLDITWLADANLASSNKFGVSGINTNGSMSWNTANNWVTAMNADGGTGYLGYTNWRLPSADANGDGYGTCFGGGSAGCADNEMDYLFVEEGIIFTMPEPFTNLQNASYWSGTDFGDGINAYFTSFFGTGGGGATNRSNNFFAFVVLPGDVSVVPIPAAVWLFGSGLIGLVGLARRKKAA